MHEFHTQRRVEFADTDLGGICHFSRYLVFMETAEHQFLEALGTSVHIESEGQTVGWPRVSVRCDYKSPARFGDVLDLRVRVLRKGTKSLTYRISVSTGGRPVAEGEVTAVCCVLDAAGEGLRAIPIPSPLAERIEEAPA